jgi:hypothetical protein
MRRWGLAAAPEGQDGVCCAVGNKNFGLTDAHFTGHKRRRKRHEVKKSLLASPRERAYVAPSEKPSSTMRESSIQYFWKTMSSARSHQGRTALRWRPKCCPESRTPADRTRFFSCLEESLNRVRGLTARTMARDDQGARISEAGDGQGERAVRRAVRQYPEPGAHAQAAEQQRGHGGVWPEGVTWTWPDPNAREQAPGVQLETAWKACWSGNDL